MKTLFSKTLDLLNEYKIRAYAINFTPETTISRKVSVQGEAEKNQAALNFLPFQWHEEDNWYTCSINGIDITLTVD